MLKLYNSLHRKIEEFKPLNPPKVSLYTCGPTVYDFDHIGHARKYVNDDILRRALQEEGYEVKHVQNITDVGHLVSDADSGEDKLEKGAKKTGKTVWETAEFYTKHFKESMKKLNVLPPTVSCKVTEHIEQQIDLVKKLVEKGFAYDTKEAVYFDVTKFKNYNKLFPQALEDKKKAVREEVKTGEYKKHPADFSLWFKRVGRFADHTMYWQSPWGDGFPGWHIECSALSMYYLGETIDIHTGGIDHLSIHHPNEIAQAEAATGKQFVRFWIHHAFLSVDGEKMSKSLGNFYKIEDIEEKGFSALDLRCFFLTAHYRTQQNFTWEALESAKNARKTLTEIVSKTRQQSTDDRRIALSSEKYEKVEKYQEDFKRAVSEDLNMPQALAVLWEAMKSNIPSVDKYDLAISFDRIFGLDLVSSNVKPAVIPEEVKKLVDLRNKLRAREKWQEADDARKKIEEKGFKVEDTAQGSEISVK